jgi:ComF family protein
VRAVCVYAGVARKAVHTLKFRSGRHVAPVLGGLLRSHLQRRPLHADLVVPAPMSRARRRERGYNQAELLAREIVDLVGGTLMADLLEKADRPPQRTLSAAERQLNLRDAIRCAQPDLVTGRRVLLVDDVMTTGATLSACADALQAAGAERVFALVFARDV